MLMPYPNRLRYWLYAEPADMRNGFDGLAGLVRNGLGEDPLRGDIFVFISRTRTILKLLYWDGDGFVLFSKRLERGRFDKPVCSGSARELRRDELLMLIEGVRLVDTRRKKRYELV